MNAISEYTPEDTAILVRLHNRPAGHVTPTQMIRAEREDIYYSPVGNDCVGFVTRATVDECGGSALMVPA